MTEIVHVDAQFLRSALTLFGNPGAFEAAARSRDAAQRAANEVTLVDAIDLCNALVLSDTIVVDCEVGGGRDQALMDKIDDVANPFRDAAVADMFRSSFAGGAPGHPHCHCFWLCGPEAITVAQPADTPHRMPALERGERKAINATREATRSFESLSDDDALGEKLSFKDNWLGISETRQCLIDIIGGTVIDARNPAFDPNRFPASA